MDAGRFKIRCPSCRAEGKARLEMLDRRVRCKHCDHTFRALPIEGDDPAGTPAPGARTPASPPKANRPARDSLRLRVEALEHEVREIRHALPSPVPRYPDPEPSPTPAPVPNELRAQLDRALGAAREAESRQISQKVADAERIEALRREVAALREQVLRDSAAIPAPAAFEPSTEMPPMPDNSRPWP